MITYAQKNERDLISACQRRDIAAFEELVTRNQQTVINLLFQLAPHLDKIEELGAMAEEVFVRVWRTINELRNPAGFHRFLIQLVMDLFHEKEEEPAVKSGQAPSEEEHKEPELLIRWAMQQLPQNLRTPLVLRELEDMNYEEIAVITRSEVGSVKTQIATARYDLHKLLTPYLEKNLADKA